MRVPFLLLLPRPAKRSESVMLGVAVLLLGGHALDLYLAILPPFSGPRLGLWEIGPVVGVLALTALALFRMLGRAPLVPRARPSKVVETPPSRITAHIASQWS